MQVFELHRAGVIDRGRDVVLDHAAYLDAACGECACDLDQQGFDVVGGKVEDGGDRQGGHDGVPDNEAGLSHSAAGAPSPVRNWITVDGCPTPPVATVEASVATARIRPGGRPGPGCHDPVLWLASARSGWPVDQHPRQGRLGRSIEVGAGWSQTGRRASLPSGDGAGHDAGSPPIRRAG
ncbi:hypothetical protein SDC9_182196 [bioreactor metagenome]|uniref:Uncharacterized protein n=1 Tax=bioreactor metagenome TaxID=1076179 RepID=A0A645H8L3_9ZZZZ